MIYIIGRGLAGTLAAQILTGNKADRSNKRDVTLIGPNWTPSRGPLHLWYTRTTHRFIEYSLRLPPKTRLVHVGYWEGRWVNKPSVEHISNYNLVTGRVGGGSMTDGQSSFVAVEYPMEAIYYIADDQVKRSGAVVVADSVKSIKVENGVITDIGRWKLVLQDLVIFTIPLPVIVELTGLQSLFPVSYRLVGTVNVQGLPFDWPSWIDYAYTYSDDCGSVYRITNNRDGSFVCEFNGEDDWTGPDRANLVKSQTPGEFVNLNPLMSNSIQVGRMARGDRSRLHDTISQIYALKETLDER